MDDVGTLDGVAVLGGQERLLCYHCDFRPNTMQYPAPSFAKAQRQIAMHATEQNVNHRRSRCNRSPSQDDELQLNADRYPIQNESSKASPAAFLPSQQCDRPARRLVQRVLTQRGVSEPLDRGPLDDLPSNRGNEWTTIRSPGSWNVDVVLRTTLPHLGANTGTCSKGPSVISHERTAFVMNKGCYQVSVYIQFSRSLCGQGKAVPTSASLVVQPHEPTGRKQANTVET